MNGRAVTTMATAATTMVVMMMLVTGDAQAGTRPVSSTATTKATSGQTTTVAGVVNVNTADAAQLALLPGVGPATAQAIVDYRTAHGPFRQTADLMQVKGIRVKRLTTIAPYVVLAGPTTATAKIRAAKATTAAKAGDK